MQGRSRRILFVLFDIYEGEFRMIHRISRNWWTIKKKQSNLHEKVSRKHGINSFL